MTTGRMALIAGSTGIVGGNLAALLVEEGWTVYGLARRRSSAAGVIPLTADLRNRSALVAALAGITPTHLFFCTWLRQPTEAENVTVNGEMIENLFAGLRGKPLQHAALVTGTKHYLGPFEAYGQTVAETPFRENSPRLPGLNFYYTQEDVLFREAAAHGFAWTVHRPHTVIGYAPGKLSGQFKKIGENLTEASDINCRTSRLFYCAFIQLSDPATLTARSEKKIRSGAPSAVPR